MVPFETLSTVSYSTSIANMPVCLAVSTQNTNVTDGRTDTAGRHRPPLCRASHEKNSSNTQRQPSDRWKGGGAPGWRNSGRHFNHYSTCQQTKDYTVSLTAISISACVGFQWISSISGASTRYFFYHAAAATPTTVTVRRKSTRVKNKHYVGDELRWKHCTVRNSRWLTISLPITGNFTHTLLASVQ